MTDLYEVYGLPLNFFFRGNINFDIERKNRGEKEKFFRAALL